MYQQTGLRDMEAKASTPCTEPPAQHTEGKPQQYIPCQHASMLVHKNSLQ